MPGPKPCPPGCACGHHNRPKQAAEEYRRKQSEAAAARRAADPGIRERERARAAAYRLDPVVRERSREQDRVRHETRRRFSRYGMTPDQFMQLVEGQGGDCYLCDRPLDLEGQRKVHIDHDHSCCRGAESCGQCVRGVVHAGCNHAIGTFGDSPERLERAAAALRAANDRVAERLAGRTAQKELPINVAPLRRKESALWLAWRRSGA